MIDRIFADSPAIRYVALYRDGELQSQQRNGLEDASAPESDRYEELLVNPALLLLALQRGNINCGGAEFVMVGYENFNQLVVDLPDGHASICFEKTANPLENVEHIRGILLESSTL